jgi:hypothetical protein
LNLQHFEHGDEETGPVHSPTGDQMTATTSGADVGDSRENRPNSVIVFFYIRVR